MSDTFEITPKMSKESQEKAQKEAFENANKVMEEINAETEVENEQPK